MKKMKARTRRTNIWLCAKQGTIHCDMKGKSTTMKVTRIEKELEPRRIPVRGGQ